MNNLVVIILMFSSVSKSFTQTDSLFFKNYEQKILENSRLSNELQTERQNFAHLSATYKKDTVALQKQIKVLQKEVTIEKQKVSDLNKNKIKEERDILQMNVDSLNTIISKQNQIIIDKQNQILNENANSKKAVLNAKNEGKEEIISTIGKFYTNLLFDHIITSSTKESIARDIKLFSNKSEIKVILDDLTIYFNARDLLLQRFEIEKIKNAQNQIGQIKRQSKLLDLLKDDLKYYHDFNHALKETINKIIYLDKTKSADGDSEIQKLKFNEIIINLADYMYNYYDYIRYSYLSTIVYEIINRKRRNADADIIDLLKKLESAE